MLIRMIQRTMKITEFINSNKWNDICQLYLFQIKKSIVYMKSIYFGTYYFKSGLIIKIYDWFYYDFIIIL